MKAFVVKSSLAILVAAFMLLFATASADASPTDDWPDGILSDNTVNLDVDIPATVSGVSAAIIGDATSESAPEITTHSPPPPPPPPAHDGGGILSNNTVAVDLDAPVTVCGIAVAGIGDASGSCSPDVNTGSPGASPSAGHGGGGIGSGNTVAVDADAPITVCGVSAAVIGNATASCSPNVNTAPPPVPCCVPPPTPPCCVSCCVPPPTTSHPIPTPPNPAPPAPSAPSPPTDHLASPSGSAMHAAMPSPLQFSGAGLVSAAGSIGEAARSLASLPFTGERTSALLPLGATLVAAGIGMEVLARRRAF